MKRNILITGAAGAIGQTARPPLRRFGLLRCLDIVPLSPESDNEECITASVTDYPAVRKAMEDIDIVFHFGGQAFEADWQTIRDVNIDGTYNVFEAARDAGVRRVVFASSNHYVGFYRRSQRVGIDVMPHPDTRYGVSKVFGEALGSLYSDKHGLEVICLRIGQFRPKPTNLRMLSLWLSPGDMIRLATRCVEAQDVRFEVVYGVSANTRSWCENPEASRLGYVPLDNAEDFASSITGQGLQEDAVEALFQGGPFCSEEFTSNASDVSEALGGT